MNDAQQRGQLAAELARRIRQGDRSAEEALARRYGPRIEFLLRRHVREPALAADLRQEALIVVIERLRDSGLDEPEKLAAFLHQTAVNLARGEARTYFRRNTHPDYDAIDRAATAEPLLADRLERSELARLVRELLGELTVERDRDILRRFYLREEDKESICASLELSPEHFDRVLYRARQRFRQILEARLGRDLTVR
ncbi:MAG: sigma-70 family RNA polymerase sigma factor [Gammaproteobacteria bacterium]|nr:sigma-70 family RNA polymerase sigma factor [Gammaproteobacteria bacterium]